MQITALQQPNKKWSFEFPYRHNEIEGILKYAPRILILRPPVMRPGSPRLLSKPVTSIFTQPDPSPQMHFITSPSESEQWGKKACVVHVDCSPRINIEQFSGVLHLAPLVNIKIHFQIPVNILSEKRCVLFSFWPGPCIFIPRCGNAKLKSPQIFNPMECSVNNSPGPAGESGQVFQGGVETCGGKFHPWIYPWPDLPCLVWLTFPGYS